MHTTCWGYRKNMVMIKGWGKMAYKETNITVGVGIEDKYGGLLCCVTHFLCPAIHPNLFFKTMWDSETSHYLCPCFQQTLLEQLF